jgi:hypothetical protein
LLNTTSPDSLISRQPKMSSAAILFAKIKFIETGGVPIRVISKTIKFRNARESGLFVLPGTISIVVLRHRRSQIS